MPGDGAIRSWWNKAWPLGGEGEPTPAVNDPTFTEVVSDFSRRLSEREKSGADPMAAARQRREALREYDRTHRHRQILIGGFAVGGLAGLVLAMITPPAAPPHLAPPASAATSGPAPAMAAVAPSPAPPVATPPATEPPSPPATATVDTPPAEVAVAATASAELAAATAAPAELLRAEEVREVQTKLRGFGFDPGPADGVPGRMTMAAATQYQQRRGLAQTGQVDRELLDQLRQDPAPQVAQRRTPVRAGSAYARREPNPLERLGQWLDSIVR